MPENVLALAVALFGYDDWWLALPKSESDVGKDSRQCSWLYETGRDADRTHYSRRERVRVDTASCFITNVSLEKTSSTTFSMLNAERIRIDDAYTMHCKLEEIAVVDSEDEAAPSAPSASPPAPFSICVATMRDRPPSLAFWDGHTFRAVDMLSEDPPLFAQGDALDGVESWSHGEQCQTLPGLRLHATCVAQLMAAPQQDRKRRQCLKRLRSVPHCLHSIGENRWSFADDLHPLVPLPPKPHSDLVSEAPFYHYESNGEVFSIPVGEWNTLVADVKAASSVAGEIMEAENSLRKLRVFLTGLKGKV